jgi:hypothetical protein
MSRTKISEYSATAADNTDINAINIAEGCAPSGINNAIREMMKQLKDFQAGTAGDSLSVGGNLSYTGTLTGSTGILNIGSGQIYKDASGNVGVGTAAPAVSGLEISRATGSASPTPVELRLSSTTNAADFSTTDPWGRLSFWSGDTSNGGAKINASIDAVAFNAVGGLSNLVFSVARTTSGILSKSIEIEGSAQNTIFYTSGSERMRITSAGNVGIGTTAPNANLHVEANTAVVYMRSTGATNADIEVAGGNRAPGVASLLVRQSAAGEGLFFNRANEAILFGTNFTERARIRNDGVLLVGTTTAEGLGHTLYGDGKYVARRSNGDVAVFRRDTSTGLIISFNYAGSAVGSISTNGTTTAYNTSSDYRLKENIVDAPSASDSIDAIQIRSFDWKADGSHQKYGVIAQELEAIAPEAVSKGEKEEDMWGVDYSKLVPMLIKEVQSLRARVAQLEGE